MEEDGGAIVAAAIPFSAILIVARNWQNLASSHFGWLYAAYMDI